jgi:alpha-glucosidase (family GH31 glycosyl hydrolase)
MNRKPQIAITRFLLLMLLIAFAFNAIAQEQKNTIPNSQTDTVHVISAQKINATTVDVQLSNRQHMLLDFYGDNIFRLFYDNNNGTLHDPQAKPPAQILVDNPRKPVSKIEIKNNDNKISISTGKITVELDKASSRFKIINGENKTVIETLEPTRFDKKQTTLRLKENPQEYFYGGGVQNGRFSHKGKIIAIENQNSWTDGGVASPTPFYWSTNGYGFMWYTFKKGKYDFGAKEKNVVNLSHETNYLDVFFMVDQKPVALLNDFYQLTGQPILLPKFGFYEGHLNAYNRDYWKTDSTGILFEDGKRYKESQKDNGGIKESLNGEKNNYQFSARGVIDRYKAHDMPLGWILPNDGYGAGYGQTGTLDSNILNLKTFGDYARKNGVQIGLWTQSDLHPKDSISALLQRDIVKEVGVAGVRVLKTDVAWVGQGYSFGLNGVADVAHIMPEHGSDARPFIISLDGWAGTQRYATVWTGDQTGGVWEYIRFHIPTYIGSGLSGQPNITSDMDGIFGGKNPIVNARDFQWKTFTPMQLNMDGWGANEKYPHALGEPTTSINRTYLKLKSQLIPYTYSIAHEAVSGLPLMRAMFLQYPNSYTLGKSTQYQYLYGPYFLIAPIYKETKQDANGNDIRNGIYLPKGQWIDYFSGHQYEGNCIINNFDAPIWKLPVFVKNGAIIPMMLPNNHVTEINKGLRIYEIYPAGKTSFTEYDDDGLTEAYKKGEGTTTLIESSAEKNKAVVTVHATKGNFDGFVKNKATEFRINVTQQPTGVIVKVGNSAVKLTKARSKEMFLKNTNVYFYDAAPNLNQFATKGSEFEKLIINKNPQLLVKIAATDVSVNSVTLTVNGFRFAPKDHLRKSSGALSVPAHAQVLDSNASAYTLKPTWNKVSNADYYEIEFNGQRYSTITDTALLFDDLAPETNYSFKLRSVNKNGISGWTTFSAKTKINPLEFAIKGITATTTAPDQEDNEISRLFDFDESSMWHTKWGVKAVPFEMVMDLMSVNQLDKIQYLPRSRGNGIILKGNISYSTDKINWTEAGMFEWAKNGDVKEFVFSNHPTARYIKIAIADGVSGYGSGRELYVFKVPGSASFIPGDINNDQKIDNNDLTSYINYTGLRKGDSDFEGYVSKGDVNKNDLIDAYDISNVATRLDGGVVADERDSLNGSIEISTDKKSYDKNEIVEIKVKGTNLRSVNAISFALPYDAQDLELVSIVPVNMKEMENMTNDRLHSNGKKSLYPTFVNIGDQELLEGTKDLFVIKFKARRKVNFNLKPVDGIMVDRHLNTVKF